MKTVLITGISRGIGRALSDKFLSEGYSVIGTVLRDVDFPNQNPDLTIFNLDLSSSNSIAECTKNITATGRKIDILVNNAGVLEDEDDTRVDTEKLRRTLEVNLIGTIDFTERIVPLMNSGGHIINISSTAGSLELVGRATHFLNHYPAYKISKAALNMYTRTLALLLRDANIIVTAVHPGWVKTDMGGEDAEITSEEAAAGIYDIAVSRPETGQFLFGKEKLPW